MDQEALAEYRYRAVCEVLGGSPIGEVAVRYGTTRQSLDSWRTRFKQEGMAGLADRSRRPHTSPTKLDADVEALICRMRREHPRWGARRISYELGSHGLDQVLSRATVHRVLTRNGLIDPQAQQHKRKYKRWQRQAPMHLWQLDIVGGLPLADGRECKLLTGIDDHSRFVVLAAVLATPSAREVAEAFTAAMRRYGVPSEVLSDNGGQFTGRFIKNASTRPYARSSSTMWRRSSRSLPRRKPSTGGCTPITISARTRPWIWQSPRACFGPTAQRPDPPRHHRPGEPGAARDTAVTGHRRDRATPSTTDSHYGGRVRGARPTHRRRQDPLRAPVGVSTQEPGRTRGDRVGRSTQYPPQPRWRSRAHGEISFGARGLNPSGDAWRTTSRPPT